MIAMKGASEDVKARFFDNMSERARGMFRDDMEAKGPLRIADVEDAQRLVRRRQRLRVQGREFDRVERLVPSAGGECEGQQVFQRVFQHHVVEARVEEGAAV